MADSEVGNVSGADLAKLVRILRQALYGADGPDRPQILVEGRDEAGMAMVAVHAGETVYRLRVPDPSVLVSLAGPPLKPMQDLADAQLPYQPRTAPQLERVDHEPGRSPVSVVLAGKEAQAVKGIHRVKGAVLAASAYTCRGPTEEAQGVEYKSFNEDAVVLRFRPGNPDRGVPELAAVGAFDQAGGEGALQGVNGAASEAAARAFNDVLAKIESGTDPARALEQAVAKAGAAVRALGVGAMTTFAGAVVLAHAVRDELEVEAHVATVGDSRVLLIARDGAIKEKTSLHNLGMAIASGRVPDMPPEMGLQFASVLTRSVGSEDDSADLYHWKLAPGDRLLVETDGVGDARELEEMPAGVWHADRCAEEQSRLLKHATTADDAVAAVVGYALDRMADQHGKPDNIGVGLIEVRGEAAPATSAAEPPADKA